MREIILITAMDFNGAIGKDNKLLCKLKDDMNIFKVATTNNIVVMGRKTFESIGKPLPNRINIVLTRDRSYRPNGVLVAHSVDDVLKWTSTAKGDVYVIGGAEIYKQFLPHATHLIITRIEAFFDDADSFFPRVDWDEWDSTFSAFHYMESENNEYPFTSYVYTRKTV